jgi:hypothetical protein
MWILTKYKFTGLINQEEKYIYFIKLLQDFYDYHFDCFHFEIPENKIAYTATNLDSLKSEMSNHSKSKYIELIEKQFRDKFNLSPNDYIKFYLISDKELAKIFPEAFKIE